MKPVDMHCFNCRHWRKETKTCYDFMEHTEPVDQCEYWMDKTLYQYEKEGKE